MNELIITSSNNIELLDYLEDTEGDNPGYAGKVAFEARYTEDPKTLSLLLESIVLIGVLADITQIVSEIFNRHFAREFSFTIKNDKGEEGTITLKNLSQRQLENCMRAFMDR